MTPRRRCAAILAVVLAALAVLVSPMAAPGSAGGGSAVGDGFCRAPVDLTRAAPGQAVVTRFAVGSHEGGQAAFNRVVIGLDRPAANYRVRYVPQIIQDGSGLPVALRGAADLEVRIESAVAHDESGRSTLPVRSYQRDWKSLREARLVGDFEGVTVFGIGVAERVDFTVSTLTAPDRLVIDLALPGQHPWNCASGAVLAYFFDEPRFIANTEPFYTPVWRRVAVPAVASGALHSLFHGPTQPEYDQGLRLLNSEALGFTGLRIDDGIARVQLVGGCDARGSTATIAGEIIPMLKQFPQVRHVKIYDPEGRTADPAGPSDSIPDCLNP